MRSRLFARALAVLLIISSGLPRFLAGQQNTSAPPVPAVSDSEVVQRQLDAYNRRDIDAYVSSFASDARVFAFPNQLGLDGQEQIRAAFGRSFAAFPDGKVEVLNHMVQGHYVVIHGRVSGVGRPPYTGIATYEVRNGKIQNMWLLDETAATP